MMKTSMAPDLMAGRDDSTVEQHAQTSAGRITRRAFVAAMPFVLAGCAQNRLSQPMLQPVSSGRVYPVDPEMVALYGRIDDGSFQVPALEVRKIDPRFLRQQVDYDGDERPGTIVIDPPDRFLYLVGDNDSALRYGIGVGREGFAWSGSATIKRKAAWPTWTPPAEMVARDERAAKFAGGMPGGLDNPLGARALYLYQGERDTLYRVHGTTEPWSIGTAVSSGCIRLFNHDIIDLHRRVPIGTKVVVLAEGGVASLLRF